MRSSSKDILTAVYTLLGGASGLSVSTSDPNQSSITVNAYTSPPTSGDRYIWIRQPQENNIGTKNSWNAEGSLDIVIIDRVLSDAGSIEIIEDIKDTVLSTIKTGFNYTTTVTEVYEWRVENISPQIQFTDDAKTFVYTITVAYQTCE